MREGDRWVRYYGFVGRRLARVPAAEIEFPRFTLLSGLECEVTLPPPPASDDPREGPRYESERPLTVTVRLRNRGGLDRSVPTEVVCNGPAFRRGVELKLSRGRENAKPFQGFGGEGFTALTPRPVVRFTPGEPARTLGPAEAFDAIRVDLNTWFEIDRPGVYRLEAAFTGESGVAEGVSNPVLFRVTPAPRR